MNSLGEVMSRERSADLHTQDAEGCYALFGRFRERLGYIPLPALRTAAARHELYATDAAAAYVWRRRDGVTTLHAIASERRGDGSRLLHAIITDSVAAGQHTIRARCPATLRANLWYLAKGFILVGEESGKHVALNVWELAL